VVRLLGIFNFFMAAPTIISDIRAQFAGIGGPKVKDRTPATGMKAAIKNTGV
jgi:hypothetical protein